MNLFLVPIRNKLEIRQTKNNTTISTFFPGIQVDLLNKAHVKSHRRLVIVSSWTVATFFTLLVLLSANSYPSGILYGLWMNSFRFRVK